MTTTPRIDHQREAEQLLKDAGADTAATAYRLVQLDEPPSPLIFAAIAHALLAIADVMPVQP